MSHCQQIAIVVYSRWSFDPLRFNNPYDGLMTTDTLKKWLAASVVLPIAFCLCLLSLLHFHSYLAFKGMTTFDWILTKRRREARQRLDRIKLRRKKEREQKERDDEEKTARMSGLSIVRHPIEVAANQFQQKHAEYQQAVKKMESALPDMMEKGQIDHVVPQGHTKGLVIEEDD